MDFLYIKQVKKKLTEALKVQTSALLHDLFLRLPQLAKGITVATPIAADLFKNFSDYRLDLSLQKVKPKTST
ncbi:hypothetical protein RCL_jg11197.t1 [Rhizophagus clarus]|uniref:Uncharacterized protein n=1 Tax=Rhizophagus clarus TaxID=94130 RepID=A0A8H3MF24_9GLOM|nr:hypothetical protein RCL_jg11197.t1 [Rhizophagus clarus]